MGKIGGEPSLCDGMEAPNCSDQRCIEVRLFEAGGPGIVDEMSDNRILSRQSKTLSDRSAVGHIDDIRMGGTARMMDFAGDGFRCTGRSIPKVNRVPGFGKAKSDGPADPTAGPRYEHGSWDFGSTGHRRSPPQKEKPKRTP